MKKFVILMLILLSNINATYAIEEQTFYLESNSLYAMFIKEKINGINIKSNGAINFNMVSDILNSQTKALIYTKDKGYASVSLTSGSNVINYNFFVGTNNKETLTEFLIKIDEPPKEIGNKK